jgi:hypothetical protein
MATAAPIPMRAKRMRERRSDVPSRWRSGPVNQASKRPINKTRADSR